MVLGRHHFGVFVVIDDGHHFARPARFVRAGAVERPAKVIRNLAEIERTLIQFQTLIEGGLGDFRLRLIGNIQLAADVEFLRCDRKRQRSEFHRRRLQRNPRRHRVVRRDRPIVLIGMPRRHAAALFFVQRLIVIQPHAFDLHQIGGDFGHALRGNEFLDDVGVLPEVGHLQKRLLIRIALFHGQMQGVAFPHLGGDFLLVMGDDLGGEDVLQLDEAVPLERLDLPRA